jgi:glycopeptide antibiotics resistance protein
VLADLRYVPLDLVGLAAGAGVAIALVVGVPTLVRGDLRTAVVRVARALLLAAVLGVLAVTLLHGVGTGGERHANLVPGAGIRAELGNLNRSLGLVNVLGNVALFVPVGLLAPVALQASAGRAIGGCTALSAAIELVQYVTGRNADVDDVLLNALGGAVGALVAVAALAVVRRTWKAGPLVGPVRLSTGIPRRTVPPIVERPRRPEP